MNPSQIYERYEKLLLCVQLASYINCKLEKFTCTKYQKGIKWPWMRQFANKFWGEGNCQVLQGCLEGLGIQMGLLLCLVMFQRPSFIFLQFGLDGLYLQVTLLLAGTTSGWIREFFTMSCQWIVSAWHRNLFRSTYTPPFKISVERRGCIKSILMYEVLLVFSFITVLLIKHTPVCSSKNN